MTETLTARTTLDSGVLLIEINRPTSLNALSTAVLAEIAAALVEADADKSLKVAVLTGNKKSFAAGADIAELKLQAEGKFPEEQRQQAWSQIRAFRKPLLAAVSGYALGGGCELMMVADIVIASKKATIGQPEINLGIMPGAGGTQALTAAVGKSNAMKMALTGEFIDAYEAHRLGLVSELAEPELYLDRTIELAEQIASKSSPAAQAIKASILNSFETSQREGLLQERQMFLELSETTEAAEQMAAFLESRP